MMKKYILIKSVTTPYSLFGGAFLFRKVKILILIIICLGIVTSGFLKISNDLPQFIKDKSPLKINYTLKPFDFSVDLDNYVVYVNEKAVSNIKNSTLEIINTFINNRAK